MCVYYCICIDFIVKLACSPCWWHVIVWQATVLLWLAWLSSQTCKINWYLKQNVIFLGAGENQGNIFIMFNVDHGSFKIGIGKDCYKTIRPQKLIVKHLTALRPQRQETQWCSFSTLGYFPVSTAGQPVLHIDCPQQCRKSPLGTRRALTSFEGCHFPTWKKIICSSSTFAKLHFKVIFFSWNVTLPENTCKS